MDLNKIVRETLALMEHQMTKSGVTVTLALDEALPRIKGNPGKLQQVLLNLFLNARDAMERGGVLALKTSAHDGRVLVTVADSGAGIARENLQKIFDPFFTTKGAKKGTGLGLSVSYGIVREHGGNIEVAERDRRGDPLRAIISGGGGHEENRTCGDRASSGRRCKPAHAISTQVVSVQSVPQQAVAQTDRLIR